MVPGHAPALRRRVDDADDLFAEIRRGDILVHHPFDSFATSFEAFVRAAAQDPDVVAMKTTRLPDERRLAGRARAHRGGGEREAERLADRAQGALRRAPQHRLVALARAGGRPRRLRLPEPEDPREDDARRPARGRRPRPLRPPRHRELQHASPPGAYEDYGLFTADPEIAADVADLFN